MNDEAKGCLAILIILTLLFGSILAIGAAVFGEDNSSEILQLSPDEGAYLPHYQNHHTLASRPHPRKLPPKVRIIGQDD